MPNHFHLLVTSPQQNLSEAMGSFMRESAKEFNRRTHQINQLWGRRFYRSEIRSPHYFNLAYKYVYRNPVTAKITSHCESYEYTSIHSSFGDTAIYLPIQDDLLVTDTARTLEWLNRDPDEAHLMSVKRALRRKVFKLPKINCRDNPLENNSL